MRRVLDPAFLSALSAPSHSDKARTRTNRDTSREGAVPFEVRSDGPAPARQGTVKSARAHEPQRPAPETRARDDAPGRTQESERPEPPRRSDPPRREDVPRREDPPRREDDVGRREDVPRREDPPGHVKGDRADKVGDPAGPREKDESEDSDETADEEGAAPDGSVETAAEAAATLAAAPADPAPSALPTLGFETALPQEAAPADPQAAGTDAVEVPKGLATIAPSASPESGPLPAGKPDRVTGLAHAVAVIGAQDREVPNGLMQAAEKKSAKELPSGPSPDSDPFGGMAEAADAKGVQEGAKVEIRPAAATQAAPAEAKAEGAGAASPLPPLQTSSGPGAQRDVPPAAQPSASQPPGAVVQQVPLGAVPIEIGLKSLAGVNRFEIRLDPAELGRIDVRLEIDGGGEVKAHLVVDRVETLNLLQRDARTLERAFEQAGLKPSEGGVDLSLRDPSADGRHGQGRDQEDRPGHGPRAGTEPEPPEAAPAARRMLWRGTAGVDVRI
jgi:flagellar hook-length control protein FliK